MSTELRTNSELKLGDTLTRVIVTLEKDANIKVNVTQHVITRQFSENGFCIDNTYFKLYEDTIYKTKSHFVQDGYGSEMYLVGEDDKEVKRCEENLIEDVRNKVEVALQNIISYKNRIDSNERNYISEVDRTPWGVDKGSKSE
ncbi:hypothetical protein NV379_02425 [Paenibacillus sp. N1-5-1-14]|uniref:hypothetical protein n=1 Tax=Paenibacillus radicibacter TaxID=2972488 RepID=UPI002158D5A8|nr:hypothetical protein [Paenibacillus radicibacter]MCR8641503.1 hypothetical protein [Paenibacillus radicibacter]